MLNEYALRNFENAEPIKGQQFTEELRAFRGETFNGTITAVDCSFTTFNSQVAQFKNPVSFTNCTFDALEFHGTYFLGGFSMRNCTVIGRASFECGGHNIGTPFELIDCRFESIACFEDHFFRGPVRFENVEFIGGTNIHGNKSTPVSTTFDIAPVLINVTGPLDLNTFGT